MVPQSPAPQGLYSKAEYERIRLFLLQTMKQAGLQVEHTVRELQERAHPAEWALVEDCIKATSVTGSHTLLEFLRAIHPGFVNRRRHERAPMKARCLVSASARDRSGAGRFCDLSLRGCRLECDLILAAGMELRLDVLLPQEGGAVTVGRSVVRWTSGRHAGVEFLHLRPDDSARLEGYVERARSVL